MFDYRALAALTAVVREGSFERAADALGITPSAVSQRVRGYEERLGMILIVRGQPCEPTDTGRLLCAHYDQVRVLEADLAPTLGGRQTEGPATLRIAVNADSLATWFPQAATLFAKSTGMLLELAVDDEEHTAERLRSGEVMAAVTSDPDPVQGCKTIVLGTLGYIACASPDFIARHFSGGVTADALAQAPVMRFDRKDGLQARWAREAHGVDLHAPTHWIPSSQGFLDLCLAGLAWGLQPLSLALPHIVAGRLVELASGPRPGVDLYWTVTRLHAGSLRKLTDAVREAARAHLGHMRSGEPALVV